MDYSQIVDSVLHNQVVTGLSFTALLGGVAYQLRNVPRLIRGGFLRFLTVELTVTSTDSVFDWMDRWLAQQPYAKRAKILTLRSHEEQRDFITTGTTETSWAVSPGAGLHIFWWRSRPVFLERHFLNKDGDSDGRRSKPIEIMHLRTIGRSQSVIRRLIGDVRSFALNQDMVSIRVWADHYWNSIRGKTVRPLDTIILRDGQIERIVTDLEWFAESQQWYAQRGIPYRRGYLFSGSPGTGKTSLVMALAGHFNKPICVLSLNAVMDDPSLFSAFNDAPANAIILIEDVDCAFPAQSRQDEKENSGGVTKAGLLNAIDGITTPDGRVFIMTTNYPERLDPALVRPGRADVHERFDYLGPKEQCRMAARFYTTPFVPLPYAVSPAVLQSVFMLHPDNPQDAHAALVDNRLATAA